jgi:predicted anti-sigma-YlaC factor YlaD
MTGADTMECTNARPLIPSYLDGELSEAQASPLRKHLLDCQPCRASAQDEKSLKRWFVDEGPVAIPKDFSARVARRAFAGDPGGTSERWSDRAVPAATPARESEDLRFLLQLTAIAAALLIGLSIAIGHLRLPASDRLMADTAPEANLERALSELDRINLEEPVVARPVAAKPGADGRPAPSAARPAGEDRPQ